MKKKSEESILIMSFRGLPFLKIVKGRGITNDFQVHSHESLSIGIITGGSRFISIGGSERILTTGDIFIINPWEPHRCSSADNIPHSYTVLLCDFNPHSYSECELSGNFIFENFPLRNSETAARFSDLISILEHDETGSSAAGAFNSFINCIIKISTSDKNQRVEKEINPAVSSAKRYIESKVNDEVPLSHLSDITGVSPFHLNRLFSSETGISPHSYHIQRRIELSKKLLLNGISIAEVSLESGFSDQSHYSRFFRKIVGTTPGNYIKYNLKKV